MKRFLVVIIGTFVFLFSFSLHAIALIIQITDNDSGNVYPSLNNGQIAWEAAGEGVGGGIYFWDGITIRRIGNGRKPSLNNGQIAYESDGIKFWDGINIHDISTEGSYPSLYNGQIAWQARVGNELDTEIFFWDGITTHQVTQNDYGDYHPSFTTVPS